MLANRRPSLKRVEAGRSAPTSARHPRGATHLEATLNARRKRRFRLAAFLTAGLAFLGARPATGQSVRGRVLELGSDRPVAAAGIILIDEKGAPVASAIADTSGNFVLRAPRPGRYWARAQRLGYVNTLSPVIELAENLTAEVTIRMEIRGIPFDTLTVVQKRNGLELGRSQFMRRCRSSEGICLTEARIRRSGAAWPNDLFESIPGMAVMYTTRGSTVRSMVGWGCFVIFVNHQIRPSNSIDDLVMEDIVGIEVYRSYKEVPRELRQSILADSVWPSGPDVPLKQIGPCGIARVWTRVAW